MRIEKIFILDDDEVTNQLTRMLLEDVDIVQNYSFQSNGWDALDYLEACKQSDNFPDLLLVDLKMPVMDGFEFIDLYEQRFWKDYPQTQVVVLTSSISERDKNRVRQLQSVGDFISKPLTTSKIKALVGAEI